MFLLARRPISYFIIRTLTIIISRYNQYTEVSEATTQIPSITITYTTCFVATICAALYTMHRFSANHYEQMLIIKQSFSGN